jgi:hypothetical protein
MKKLNKNNKEPTDQLPFSSIVFTTLANAYAEQKMTELKIKGGLLEPEDTYLEKEKTALLNDLDKHLSQEEKLYEEASHIIKEQLSQLPNIEKGRINKEIANNSHLFTDFLKKIDGRNLEEISKATQMHFSEETYKWIYDIGYKAFQAANYKNAKAVFFFLTKVNSSCADYWVGLGISQRNLNEKEEALNSFSIASLLNPEHPSSRYNSSELYLELGQTQDALLEYEVLAEIIETQKLNDLKLTLKELKNKIHSTKI